MCKTRSSLDCQLCRNPGCMMLCGNVAMEAITAIASSTATLFQIQQATNVSKPLPFPTARKTTILEKAYNSAATRGRPTHSAITTLMRETGVGVKEIKAWFTDARKAPGHAEHRDTQSREAAASIEMRTRLPTLPRDSSELLAKHEIGRHHS